MSTADIYTMKIKLLITILLISTLAGCRSPRHNRTHKQPPKKVQVQQKPAPQQPQKRYVTITPYQTRLEGVECNLCAQAATKILSAFDGLDTVQIALVDEDAEYAAVNFMWNKKAQEFDLTAINQALSKEGFEMTEIAAQKSVVTVVKS